MIVSLSGDLLLAVALPGAPPSRMWLEQAAWLVPAGGATRALLGVDAVLLVLMALRFRRPWLAVPAGLAAGFLTLTALAMLLTDFFAGLLLFHALVAAGALAAGGVARWAGAGLLALILALGLLT